jgi:hypothetical protein
MWFSLKRTTYLGVGESGEQEIWEPRDDKKERVAVRKGWLLKDRSVVKKKSCWGREDAFSSSSRPLLAAALSFLSSRAKPRDLRFRGHVLEK